MPSLGLDRLGFTIFQIDISARKIAELVISSIHKAFLIPLRNKMIISGFVHCIRRNYQKVLFI